MQIQELSGSSCMEMRHEQVLQFLKQHDLGVLCTTCEDGTPQGAIVEILPTDKMELIFATHKESRKYKNLSRQKTIAFVVGSYEEISVQFEGICEEIAHDAEEYALYAQHLASKMRSNYFPVVDENDFALFRATPTWIRYSDVGQKPWDVAEMDFLLPEESEKKDRKYIFPFSFS